MGHKVTETTSSTVLLQLFLALKVKTETKNGIRKIEHAKKKKESRKYALQRCLHLATSSPIDT
jgi:hypothetical protein